MKITRSHKTRLSLALITLLFFTGLASLKSELVQFENSTDLNSYTLLRSNAPDPALTVTAADGQGDPASGGLRYTATNSGKRSAVLLRPMISGAGDTNVWETSVLLNPREVDDIVSGEKKSDLRIGFSVSTNVTSGKLDEFYHKTNPSITLLFKAEHKVGDSSKTRLLEFEVTSNTGSESKFGKLTLSNSASIDHWLRLRLTVTRSGTDTFEVEYLVEDLGTLGTTAPTVIASHTQSGVTHSTLANAVSIYSGFLCVTDKSANSRLYFDEHETLVESVEPDAPIAQAADTISAPGAMLHWSPASTGLPATGFVVELSTVANNFSPGTLVGASGETGLTNGVEVSDPLATSLSFSGLLSDTAYRYRVRAVNGAGQGEVSNVVDFSTLEAGANASPTLDFISNPPPVLTNAGAQTLILTGIGMGEGDEGQPISVSVSSSDPSVVPTPGLVYHSPDSTAWLTFQPAGVVGTSLITVTVEDGEAENGSFQQSFTVTVVAAPPESLEFADVEEFDEHFDVSSGTGVLAFSETGGVDDGGGLQFQAAVSDTDNDVLVIRAAPFPGNPTLIRSSVMVNFREVGATLLSKARGEVRLGFADHTNNIPSARKNFFESQRQSIHVRLSAEHEPGKKDHEFSVRAGSYNGSQKSESNESKFSDSVAMSHWLRVSMEALPIGGGWVTIDYKVEDFGEDGTEAFPQVIAEGSFNALNPGFLGSEWLHSAFTMGTEKKDLVAKIYADNHRTEVLREAPGVPLALPVTAKTASSIRASWQGGDLPPADSYLLEVSTAANDFASGTLLAADGSPGNNSGIFVNGSEQIWITGLSPSTEYIYRVRSLNAVGISPVSNEISGTTLGAGENAPPTLNALPSLTLSVGSGARSISLGGITDGGEGNQSLVVTVISSDPSIIPHPTVDYSTPEETGSITLLPAADEAGEVTITVTVDDGAASNNQVSRQFLVSLLSPSSSDSFEGPNPLSSYQVTTLNSAFTSEPGVGVADSVTGIIGDALRFERLVQGNNSALVVHPQIFPGNPTALRTSLMVNLAELNTVPPSKAEIRLGFATSPTPTSEPKKFFEEGRNALSVRFSAEHNPLDNKVHEIKLRGLSFDGASKNESSEITIVDEDSFENWVRVTLIATPLNATLIQLDYVLENMGPDGDSDPTVIAEFAYVVSNAGFLAAQDLYGAFAIEGSNQSPVHGILLDEYQVEILRVPPSAPLALDPVQITSQNALLRWQASPLGAAPLAYRIEITGGESPLDFLIEDPNADTYRIMGLEPETEYQFTVQGVNSVGDGAISNIVSFTTLGEFENAPPTLDPISDLVVLMDSVAQEVRLSGLSDGGEMDQGIVLDAWTNNPALIGSIAIGDLISDTEAILSFTPAEGSTGTASITVYLEDGLGESLEREFEVTIIDPEPLMTFASEAELDSLIQLTTVSVPGHSPASGIAPVDGSVEIERDSGENVVALLRPYAFDAVASGSLKQSIFFRAPEIASFTSGSSDKVDVRLAFLSDNIPSGNLKDFFHKSHPALGVRFQLEHEPSDSKNRRVVAEVYSSLEGSESKGAKVELDDVDAIENWLKFEFIAVKTGDNQYSVSFRIEDWGPLGTEFEGLVAESEPWLVSNSVFANDRTIHGGVLINGNKEQSTPLYLDQHYVLGDTRAPFAPLLQPAFAVTGFSLTTAWEASSLGRPATGYFVELSLMSDSFAPNTFFDVNGLGGQSQGVWLDDPSIFSLTFNGLDALTTYIWRVIPVRNDAVGVAGGSMVTVTSAPTLIDWQNLWFDEEELLDENISGPMADPNGNGVPNLLEFAFGGDPVGPGSAPLQELSLTEEGRLKLSHRRLKDSAQLQYIVEASSNLVDWSSTGLTVLEILPADEDGYETITVLDDIAAAGSAKRFMRVRVIPQF